MVNREMVWKLGESLIRVSKHGKQLGISLLLVIVVHDRIFLHRLFFVIKIPAFHSIEPTPRSLTPSTHYENVGRGGGGLKKLQWGK